MNESHDSHVFCFAYSAHRLIRHAFPAHALARPSSSTRHIRLLCASFRVPLSRGPEIVRGSVDFDSLLWLIIRTFPQLGALELLEQTRTSFQRGSSQFKCCPFFCPRLEWIAGGYATNYAAGKTARAEKCRFGTRRKDFVIADAHSEYFASHRFALR